MLVVLMALHFLTICDLRCPCERRIPAGKQECYRVYLQRAEGFKPSLLRILVGDAYAEQLLVQRRLFSYASSITLCSA